MPTLLFWESFTRHYFILNRKQLKYLIFWYRSWLLAVCKSSALSCHDELGKFTVLHETVMCLVEDFQGHPDLFNDRLYSNFSWKVFKLNHLRDQSLISYPVLLLVALPSTLHDVIGLILCQNEVFRSYKLKQLQKVLLINYAAFGTFNFENIL